MKRVLFLLSLITIMLNTMFPVFASSITNESQNKTSTVEVKYEMENTYIVTIPAEFSLSGTTISEGTISASNVIIPYGTSLNVTIESDNYSNDTWNLVDKKEGATSNKVAYGIGKSKTENSVENLVASKGVVLSVPAGTDSSSQKLYVQVPTAPAVAGDYQDTLRFTVEVKE